MQLPDNLLCDRRPEKLQRAIDTKPAIRLRDRLFMRYFSSEVTANTLLETAGYASANVPKKTIIDIGKNSIVAILNEDELMPGFATRTGSICATVIGAVRPRHLPADIRFIAENVENRSAYQNLEKPASLIVSQGVHLIDSIGTLELCLNSLEVGGMFLGSDLYPNVYGDHSDIEVALNDADISVVEMTCNTNYISSLALQRKNDEPIRLAFDHIGKYFGMHLVLLQPDQL